MRSAIVMCLFCTTVLLASTSVHAQTPAPSSSAPSSTELLRHFGTAPNGLVRYTYLTSVIPLLHGDDKALAQQLLATVESELGLYNEAVMTFPFDNRIAPPRSVPLPNVDEWRSVDAADAVTEVAANRNIVMINEAHHDAHTRELTLALLPRLRAQGYRYFAAEALDDKDLDLMQRGYPTDQTGSEYLMEPLYGEIIRQAIRLGYTIVPYDPENADMKDREADEARALYEKVFAKDPQAKLFIHAGYAHIDKTAGNLDGDTQPMAVQLKRLTGHDPLSVDQVQFRDVAVGGLDFGFYSKLVVRFHPQEPIVLRDRHTNAIWSSDSTRHDITVILPPAVDRDVDVNGLMGADVLRQKVVLPGPPFDPDQRPAWLSLGGKRTPFRIDLDLCSGQLPCVVDAYYPNEPDASVPADRYTFIRSHYSHNELYLYPGRYRLRAWNASGATLSEQEIDVSAP